MADGPAQAVATERIIPIKPTRSDLINIEIKYPHSLIQATGIRKIHVVEHRTRKVKHLRLPAERLEPIRFCECCQCRAKSRHLSIFFVGTQMSSRLQTSNAERSNPTLEEACRR